MVPEIPKGNLAKKYGRHALAANELINALGVVQNNAPINASDNPAQAGLENQSAQSFQGALNTLAEDAMKRVGSIGAQHHKRYGPSHAPVPAARIKSPPIHSGQIPPTSIGAPYKGKR